MFSFSQYFLEDFKPGILLQRRFTVFCNYAVLCKGWQYDGLTKERGHLFLVCSISVAKGAFSSEFMFNEFWVTLLIHVILGFLDDY